MTTHYDPHLLATSLRNALDLWLVLSGVDPQKKSFKINLSGGMDERTVSEMHSEIAEALDLDASNITGYLLLNYLSEIYFTHRTFTIRELITEPHKTSEYLTKTREFLDIVQAPEMIEIGDNFVSTLRRAAEHYQANSTALSKLLSDQHQLAMLRRDALRSMETLRIDQFLMGAYEKDGVTPVYLEKIHRFWNINSLIRACCTQPPGVSLNLVVDPDNYHSYFVFAIRNGGNLFTLSDVPVHATPLAKYESRRPDREFLSRRSKHWFPYDLLGMKFRTDENGDQHLYFDRSGNTQIVPIQQSFEPLSSIQDLNKSEFMWIIMMFDLIMEKFWQAKYKAPALSYTGGMVKHEVPLSLTATEMNLPVVVCDDLRVAPLGKNDVCTSDDNAQFYGKDGGSHNLWLEARYAGQIDDDVLNLVATPDTIHYLAPVKDTAASRRQQHPSTAVVSTTGLVTAPKKDRGWFYDNEGRTELFSLDASSFGTSTELESNRRYIARYNYAQAIQRLADAEYEKTHVEIVDWYRDAITNNIDALLDLVKGKELRRPMQFERFPGAQYYGNIEDNSFLFMAAATDDEFADKYNFCFPSSSDISISGGNVDGYFRCYVTKAKANARVMFVPRTAEDIAFLVGQKISELPQVLQHWCAELSYEGNHSIDKIDPLSWGLRNPWERRNFAVTIWLSKRGLNQLLKN